MRTRPLLLPAALALLAIAATHVLAQTPAPTTPAAPATPTPASEVSVKSEEPSHSAATKAKDGKETLSVDFPDEDITNILRNVADLFELNIVIPPALQGKASIKLRDVTWRQIFTSVLTPVGYTYIEDGNIIKIVSNETLQQEPTQTDVFILNYARAADILPTLTSLVDGAAGGKIVADARSNSLVIPERPSRMNRIRPILAQLDRATDQVMMETKFIEVTDSDVKNVGVNWASLGAYNTGVLPSAQTDHNRTQTTSDGFTSNNGNNGTTTNGTTNTTTGTQTTGTNNTGNVSTLNGVVCTTLTTGTNGTASNTITSAVSSVVSNTITTALNNLASLTT